jgi:hypothetical protein
MTTTVTVTVDKNQHPSVTCIPSVLKVSRADGKIQTLTFNLATPGYSFPPEGAIVILSTTFPSACQAQPTTQASDQSFVALTAKITDVLPDDPTGFVDYPYRVVVQASTSSGEHYYTTDPIIRNGP